MKGLAEGSRSQPKKSREEPEDSERVSGKETWTLRSFREIRDRVESVFSVQAWGFHRRRCRKNPAGDYSINTHGNFTRCTVLTWKFRQ
jgi:hypothetical protein